MLASRDRYAAFRTRRVVIKTWLIKLAGQGLKGAGTHLRYLQRDGVTREGLPGDLYDATLDRSEGAGSSIGVTAIVTRPVHRFGRGRYGI